MKYERLTFRHKSVVDGTEQIGYTEKLIPCYRKEDMILKRLAELEDKIENGTLIELPCKVGDTIYVIPHIWDMKGRFVGEIDKRKADSFYVIGGFVDIEDDIVGEFYRVGEEVFLTREEAEKRLKELQK